MDFTSAIDKIRTLLDSKDGADYINEMLNKIYSEGYRDGQESVLQEIDKQSKSFK